MDVLSWTASWSLALLTVGALRGARILNVRRAPWIAVDAMCCRSTSTCRGYWTVRVMSDAAASAAACGCVSRVASALLRPGERDVVVAEVMDVIESAARRRRPRPKRRYQDTDGMRFAFYGRMSTREYQDRATSSRWQREMAEETIAGHGTIVEEYFDEGCSRRLSWPNRPAAAALLIAADSPDRAFDAIVVGEYERAFAGEQFRTVLAILERHGVPVWLPEAGGPVNLEDPTHRALMVLLGAHSRREVVRARHRVWAAMRTQTVAQGRFLGGRPPYGYLLVDAGPHPNIVHAQWGRRLHRLEPDPATASVVRWIFTQRASGRSVASLARELNERGVPCPSQADRARNRHRSGEAWLVRTLVGILENPRYTGRQVWNRHGTTIEGDWVVSRARSHPALVEDTTFLAVQGMRAVRRTQDGDTRTYLLAGLVMCDRCGRRLESHTAKNQPGYRCRHGRTSASARSSTSAKPVYIAERRLLAELQLHLAETVDQRSGVIDYLRSTGQVIIVAGPTWSLGRGGPTASADPEDHLSGWGSPPAELETSRCAGGHYDYEVGRPDTA